MNYRQDNRIGLFTYCFGTIAVLISSCFIFMTIVRILSYYCHPLENAICRGDIVAINQAIADGHDVNAKDKYGHTMLICAIQYGISNRRPMKHPTSKVTIICQMVEILVAAGADINALDDYEDTALCSAINWSDPNVVKLLIRKDADVNLKGRFGETPLHFAVRSGRQEVVQMLLDTGADPNIKNKDGVTPLELAMEIQSTEIAKLLREHETRKVTPNNDNSNANPEE